MTRVILLRDTFFENPLNHFCISYLMDYCKSRQSDIIDVANALVLVSIGLRLLDCMVNPRSKCIIDLTRKLYDVWV
jgi:hypothetical protein